MAIDTAALKTVCYLRDLPERPLAEIRPYFLEKKYSSGQTILWEGEKADSFYFVISGLAKLVATSADGREFVVRVAFGGDSANDDAVFSGDPTLLTVTAMSPVLLYAIGKQHLAAAIESYPAIGNRVAEVFAHRQRYLVRLSTELVFKNVAGRLARLLLDREKLVDGEGKDLRITQQEMAAMVGTVREIVSRSLKEMEAMHAVALEHNQIIIKDRKMLEQLSGA